VGQLVAEALVTGEVEHHRIVELHEIVGNPRPPASGADLPHRRCNGVEVCLDCPGRRGPQVAVLGDAVADIDRPRPA
jgi:hypothetical protein